MNIYYWVYLVGWLLLAVVAGMIAHRKGRSPVFYFLLSVLLSPLIGLICVAITSTNRKQIEEREIRSGAKRRCPRCAEVIQRAAKLCPHCRSDLSSPLRVIEDPVEEWAKQQVSKKS